MSGSVRKGLTMKQLQQVDDILGITYTDEETETDAVEDLKQFSDHHQDGQNCSEMFLPTWQDYFEVKQQFQSDDRNLTFNCYWTLPRSYDALSIPIFIFHHGAGSSGLTFASLAKVLCEQLNGKCGVFSFDSRGHGLSKFIDASKPQTFNLNDFRDDFIAVISKFYSEYLQVSNVEKLSLIFAGHSLGGAVSVSSFLAMPKHLKRKIIGVGMFDMVEEAAILALDRVDQFLNVTPNRFENYQAAIKWYIHQGLSHTQESATISVPALFKQTESGEVVRITELRKFRPYWDTWFTNLSQNFVSLPTSKILILAGSDNLDKSLIVGQMQGKYQLVVFQDSGHFIQEDVSLKTAVTLIEFWKRNDNKNVVIKTNWGSFSNAKTNKCGDKQS